MTTSSDSYPTVESYGIPKNRGLVLAASTILLKPPQSRPNNGPKPIKGYYATYFLGVHLRHEKDLTPTPKSMLRNFIIGSAPRSALPTGAPKPDLTPPTSLNSVSGGASAPQTPKDKTKKLLCLKPSNQKRPIRPEAP